MIGRAEAGDRAAVVALWHACGLTRPWNDPDADFRLALDGASSTILVVREGERIVGSAMVGFDGHRGWVYYLAVASAERRGGIGRALMAAAEAWLRERGAPKLQLMVRADNDAARGFYAALGYEVQDVAVFGRRLEGPSASATTSNLATSDIPAEARMTGYEPWPSSVTPASPASRQSPPRPLRCRPVRTR